MAETMCDKGTDGFQCYRPPNHEGPCALAPVPDNGQKVEDTIVVPKSMLVEDQKPQYGWKRPKELDVQLPTGSIVRIRLLNRARLVELNIMEMLDSFTPELLKSMSSGQVSNEETTEALNEALMDTKRREALLNPVNRVVLAAVVCPTVVAEGPTNEEQINVHDVELEDRLAIFGVAFADQLEDLKSLQGQQAGSVGSVSESESV